jgi:hypothetical protein
MSYQCVCQGQPSPTGKREIEDDPDGTKAGSAAGQAFARNVGAAFGDAFQDAVVRDKSIRSTFRTLIQDLQSSLLQSVVETSFSALLGRGDTGDIVRESFAALVRGFTFAEGGVMGPQGAMPLQTYARGGIADSPQLALFGEGRTPEAFVPLPDGRRIPVQMDGAAGARRAVSVVNHITVNAADAGSFRRAEGQIGAEIAGRLQRHLSRNG